MMFKTYCRAFFVALFFFLSTAPLRAAEAPFNAYVSQEDAERTAEDIQKNLAITVTHKKTAEEICKSVGLNPEYGLGSLRIEKYYTYDEVPRNPTFKHCRREAEYHWDNWFGDQRATLLVDVTEPAKLAVICGGANFFKEYYELEAMAKMQNQETTGHRKQTAAQIEKLVGIGRLMISALKNFEAHKREVGVVLATFSAFCGSLIFFYYFFKEGVPRVMQLIFTKKPQIVKDMRLSRRFWRSQIAESVLDELSYAGKIQSWLEESIEKDSMRVKRNLATQRHWLLAWAPTLLQRILDHFSPLPSRLNFVSLLLKGPPGTGKTAMARNYAAQIDADFIHVGGSAWSQLDEAEALVSFNETLALAEKNPRPVVLFIDEVDVVFPKRIKTTGVSRKLTSAFLEAIEKPFHDQIKFVFATNLPEELDPAIRSRIAEEKKIDLPTEVLCQKIYATYLGEVHNQTQPSSRG